MAHKHFCLQLIDWLRMLVLVLVVLIAAPAAAQIIDWNNMSGGAYATAGNWNPANVPDTISETAQFNLANTFRVTFGTGSSTTIDDLLTSNGVVTFSNLGAIDSTLNISDDAILESNLTLAKFLTTGDVNLNIADLLLVGGGSTFSVSQGAAVTVDTLDLGITASGNGTMIVDGAGSSLAVAGANRIGRFGKTGTLTFQNDSTGNSLGGLTRLVGGSSATNSTGRLNVLSGASLQTASIDVGLSNSASAVQEGTLTVDGKNSLLTMTGASILTIGDETNPNVTADVIVSSGGQFDTGTGAITIRTPGHLRVAGGTFNANGPITMDSTSTLTLTTGGALNANAGLDNSADGTLELFNGTLTVTGGAFVPNAGGLTDDYSVDGLTAGDMPHLVLGTGATANIGQNLYVGDAKNGELTIGDGATLSSNAAGYIGNQDGSTGTVTVDGAGSTWTNSSNLFVGFYGDGTLYIQNGGEVTSNTGNIGELHGSTGAVTVDGAGSTWTNSHTLQVGDAGVGTLNIQNGGTVSNTRGYINGVGGVTSEVNVDGIDGLGNPSTWTNSSILYVGESSAGTLNILNGGTVSNSHGYIGWFDDVVGTVTVDGTNSTWTNSSNLFVGFYGDGTLNILSGGTVSSSNSNIGRAPGSTGTVTVDGTDGLGNPSTWTISHDVFTFGLYIGGSDTSGGTGTLNVQNSGLVEVDGVLKIWNAGDLNIAGGTLNASGLITMASGSALTLTTGGALNANAGLDNSADGTLELFNGTLTVTGGAFVPNAGGLTDDYSVDGLTAGDMPHLVLGTGATANIGRHLFVGNFKRGELTVVGGGVISNTVGVIGEGSGSTGTVTVDGLGSTWTNSGDLAVGDFGNGTLNIFDNGAVSSVLGMVGNLGNSTGTATVDDATWTNSSDLVVGSAGHGTLNIQNDGAVSNASGFIGFSAVSTGTVTVDGTDGIGNPSIWTNSSDLFVGGNSGAAGGNGTLNVQNSGLVEVGGVLKIWGPGTVNLNGGSIITDTFDNSAGGTFNFLAGSLRINSGIAIGSGVSFPQNLTLSPNQWLLTTASTTIATNRTLTLDGGGLRTNDLTVNGVFQFNSGTLRLTGGSITGISSLVIPANGVLVAAGGYSLPITGAAGSVIKATADLTLGDASLANGFYSNGALNVGANIVTLQDANDVAFDTGAVVALGNLGGSAGTLSAANGLTLDFGGNITGFGIVNTPNNAATPLINNGHIAGYSGAEPIELTGYVKGVGTLDNVVITGTDAPGLSPAAVNRGSITYNGTLEIELGGTSPGSGFDQLNHILGVGIADLGGTLDVQLIDGFITSPGDTFEVITAASILGTFDTLNLPSLTGDLLWFVNYGATSVELVSTYGADFDENGIVDGSDLTAWESGFGGASATHMTGDANADTTASGFDFLTWQRQFGRGVGSPLTAATTIPEPSTLLLPTLCLLLLPVRWKRA